MNGPDAGNELAALKRKLADAVELADEWTRTGHKVRTRCARDLFRVLKSDASPRTVRTADELDALPADTVIRNRLDEILVKSGELWFEPGYDWDRLVDLPARILYLPADEAADR
ncbi:hypothetical protein ACFYVR_15860 [Rhodococcus sp. NPDC003318]|uniref:hypothetical protein n=1 Tax=Rhodococcus sp. NPDC003318 TaxID=3364503 RepID=UPI003693AB26